jgi:rare lipoprotein A
VEASRGLLVVIVVFSLSGCTPPPRTASSPPPPPPSEPASPSPPASAPLLGKASWYGTFHHGRRTASGEIFNMHALTAAHRTLPLGTRVRVTNVANGKWVDVRVNDRGPFIRNRMIDLSRAAAAALGAIERGVFPVEVVVLD